jgi:hypothetical protein
MAMQITPTSFGSSVFNGNISIGNNFLRTADLLLKQNNATELAIRNSLDTSYQNLSIGALIVKTSGITMGNANVVALTSNNTDSAYGSFQARDNGVGLVEVARLQGAADPYFQATLPIRLLPGVVPGTPLEGHFWYDNATKKLMFYDNVGAKTVTSLP